MFFDKIFHPILFAIFPILFLYSNNINSVSPNEIIFPLLFVIFVTILIWIVLWKALKNKIKSGFITSLGLVLFFSYGHIYIFLEEFQYDILLNHILLLISSFILFGLGTFYFLKTKRPLNNATKIVNVVALSLIMISFVSVGEYFFTESLSPEILNEGSKEKQNQLANAESLPDIYYIIPDSYAGSKSLQIILNYDNSEFIDILIKQGFYVAPESYSNYIFTRESIASTFNLKYINYLADEKG